jgi:hypothetical protein
MSSYLKLDFSFLFYFLTLQTYEKIKLESKIKDEKIFFLPNN